MRSRSASPQRGDARPQTEFITEFSLGEEPPRGRADAPRERRAPAAAHPEERTERAQQCAPHLHTHFAVVRAGEVCS